MSIDIGVPFKHSVESKQSHEIFYESGIDESKTTHTLETRIKGGLVLAGKKEERSRGAEMILSANCGERSKDVKRSLL